MHLLQLAVVGLSGSGVTIMIALGFQLVFSTSRMFHFAYAGIYAVVIYLMYSVLRAGMSLWIALVLAAVGALVLSAVMELVVYRHLRRSGASQLAILIASLGMLTLIQASLSLHYGNIDINLPTPGWLTSDIHLGSIDIAKTKLAELIVDLAVYAIFAGMLRFTGFGRSVRAVADDPGRARMLGVNVDRVIMGVLLAAGVALVPVAAAAGMDTGQTPYASTDVLLVASIIVFVGGLGSMTGTLVVGLVVGVLSGVVLEIVPSQWTDALTFAVLVWVVLVRPRGLFYSAHRAREV